MNPFSEKVESLLGRVELAKEIQTLIDKKENIYGSLPNNQVFKDFIENLNALASPSNNLETDKSFFQLIEAVNEQLIKQLNKGEQDMNPVLIIGGVGLIIGIGLYAYSCQQKKENKTTSSSNTSKRASVSKKSTVTYEQLVLLLVIDAQRLEQHLKEDMSISKDAAETLISNATFAYCFTDRDANGEEVLKTVDYSDDGINYELAEQVFVQLDLSAKPAIATGKPDRLAIREALNPSQQVAIKKIKKLQTARSITAFHSI